MPELSPESLAQIRAIVDGALARALETIDRRFDGVDHRLGELEARLGAGLAENRRHLGAIEALDRRMVRTSARLPLRRRRP